MEELVAPIALESQKVTSDSKSVDVTDGIKRPAPVTGGCRVEGFVRVKKVVKFIRTNSPLKSAVTFSIHLNVWRNLKYDKYENMSFLVQFGEVRESDLEAIY